MSTTTSSDTQHVKTALRIGGGTALAFLALLSVWASISPAAAEDSLCAGREQVRQALAEKFGEAPVALGLVDRDTMIEVFAGSEGATWTIIVSVQDGESCVLSAGTDWRGAPAARRRRLCRRPAPSTGHEGAWSSCPKPCSRAGRERLASRQVASQERYLQLKSGTSESGSADAQVPLRRG